MSRASRMAGLGNWGRSRRRLPRLRRCRQRHLPRLATPEPGEFTQLFQKAPSSTVKPEERPAAQTAGPGEFTQLFQRSGSEPADGSAATSGAIGGAIGGATPAAVHADGSGSSGFGESAWRVYTAVPEPAQPAVRSVTGATAGRICVAKYAGRVHADLRRRNAQRKQPALRDAPPRAVRRAPPSSPGSLTESLEPRQKAPAMTPSAPSGPGEFTRVIGVPLSASPPASHPPRRLHRRPPLHHHSRCLQRRAGLRHPCPLRLTRLQCLRRLLCPRRRKCLTRRKCLRRRPCLRRLPWLPRHRQQRVRRWRSIILFAI